MSDLNIREVTLIEEIKEHGGYMANGGELNKGVRKLAASKGFTPKALGKDYEKVMAQAVVEALTNSNYHNEARKLVSILEKNPKIAEKPNYPSPSDPKFKEKMVEIEKVYGSEYFEGDAKTKDFGRKVSQEADFDGYAIADAFEFVLKMDGGYQKLANDIKKAVGDSNEMAKGGMMEHGLRIGDKVTTDMFWDNQIVVENQKTNKRAQIDLENGKRKDEMADGGMMAHGGETNNFNQDDYSEGVVLEKSAKASNDNEVYDILNKKWRKYKIVNSRAFDLETPYNRGWIDEGITINVYLLKDTNNGKYYWDSDYIKARKGQNEYPTLANGGMMAHGGETHRLDSIFEDGGEIAEGNLEMAMSNVKAIGHHAQELKSLLNDDTSIEAWVVAKLERAETDLSDVTHYIDGLKGEEVESDTYFARGGLTKDETLKVAEKYAEALSKSENKKVTVNTRTLQEDSFDLDMDGIEYDGGSYNIYDNGDVKNMALSESPVYGKTDSSSEEIVLNLSKYARGGFVSKGELVWRKLSDSKKMEFLYENFTPQITPRSQETLVGKDFQFLPKDVKIKLEAKYANVEEYAKGGELIPYIIWVSKDGEKREMFGEYKSKRAADMKMNKLWESGEYKTMGNKPKSMYEKEGFYADGGMMANGGRLSRKQKQLDLNKNGKLDSQDFKMLRAGRKNARKK
jgi:hypothetical protein